MRASRILLRSAVTVGVLMLLLLGCLLLMPEPKTKVLPPLPFDTNAYSSTTMYEIFPTHLPPHPTLKDRFAVAYFKLLSTFKPYRPDPTNTTFAASPVGSCSIMGFLDQCMQASGVRYLMSREVSVGIVKFGTTNALNGRQWIPAFENALETASPGWWDASARKWQSENLALIRYPAQHTVLVLTQSQAREFRRTNSTGVIDPPCAR